MRDHHYYSWGIYACLIVIAFQTTVIATEGRGYGSTETGYEAQGFRLGTFVVFPEISAALESDSNVFSQQVNEQDDLIWHIKPEVSINSNWGQHGINIYTALDSARHNDLASEDWDDYFIDASGWFDVRRNTKLNGQAAFHSLHEDRFSPNNVFGIEPVTANLTILSIGIEHRFNRLLANLSYDFKKSDYDDVLGRDPLTNDIIVIDSDDRDQTLYALTLRLGYDISERLGIFISQRRQRIDYNQRFDDDQFQRSSDSNTLDLGVNFKFTHLLSGDVYIRQIDQDYDDVSLGAIGQFSGGADVVWKPTELTVVQGNIEGSVVDSIVPGVSGFFRTSYIVKVDHELRRNILLKSSLRYAQDNFEGSSSANQDERDDNTTEFDLSAKYLFNRHFYLEGAYEFTTRSSNIRSAEYDRELYSLKVGVRW